MKTTKLMHIFILAIITTLIVSSCGNNKKRGNPPQTPEYYDTLTVMCENGLKDMMQYSFESFHEQFPGIIVDVEYGTSLDCSKARLSNQKNAVIMSRDLTVDEMTLAKEYHVMIDESPIAQDGFIFFAHKDFPIDSLYSGQIKSWLTDPNYKLSNQFEQLEFEPLLVTTGAESGAYMNLSALCADSQTVKRPVKVMEDIHAIKDYVREHKNAIGSGYLSSLYADHISGDSSLIAIRIGYHHKDGNHEAPQIVDRAWVIQYRYPYVVNYEILARANLQARNKTMRFINHVVLNKNVQKGFFDMGMIPEHAKFELIKED